jgi:hypothetical protein
MCDSQRQAGLLLSRVSRLSTFAEESSQFENQWKTRRQAIKEESEGR